MLNSVVKCREEQVLWTGYASGRFKLKEFHDSDNLTKNNKNTTNFQKFTCGR